MSLNEGPTSLMAAAWQAMQFLVEANVMSARAGVTTTMPASRAGMRKKEYFIKYFGLTESQFNGFGSHVNQTRR